MVHKRFALERSPASARAHCGTDAPRLAGAYGRSPRLADARHPDLMTLEAGFHYPLLYGEVILAGA